MADVWWAFGVVATCIIGGAVIGLCAFYLVTGEVPFRSRRG